MTEEQSPRRSWKAARAVVMAVGALMVAVAVRSGIASGVGRVEILMALVGTLVVLVGVLGPRTGAAYRGAALVLLNSLVLFVALELGASVILHTIAPSTAVEQPAERDPDAIPDPTSPYYDETPWAERYWAEMKALKSWYHPYVLWRRAPYAGQLVKISATGLRETPGSRCGPGAFRVFTFGGSTMWGYGVPDWGTIPAYLQGELQHRLGRDVCVVNFGELGFNSTQSVITLMRRLQCGDVPDLVIFYDGVNDISYPFIFGIPGIHRSVERVAARLDDGAREEGVGWIRSLGIVRLAQVLVGEEQPAPPPSRYPYRHADMPDGLDEGIAATYLNNHSMVRALATRYGFAQAFFWQPYLTMGRKPLAAAERRMAGDPFEAESPEDASRRAASRRLFESVYARIEAAASEHPDLFYLAGVFDTVPSLLYTDSHHLTHEGNHIIARRMLEQLRDQIATPRQRTAPAATCPDHFLAPNDSMWAGGKRDE
jgi:lysophospholipase L1-like esterase